MEAAGSDAVLLVGERAGAGALAAAGRIADHLGAKVAFVPRGAGTRGALDAGLASGLLPGGRSAADEQDRADVAAVWGDLADPLEGDLEELLTRVSKKDVDVLWLVGYDPLRDATSSELVRKALKKVGTVIVQDIAISPELAESATVVLPVTATQERAGAHTDWEGRTGTFRRAVEGPQLVQDDWEIATQLAGMLGADLGYNDLDGIRLEIDKLGVRATAHDWPALEVPEALETKDDELRLVTYPLLLDDDPMLVGADDLKATAREPRVVLSVTEAEARGLEDGDLVTVTAKKETVTLPLAVEADLVDGAVFVPATPVNGSDAGRELHLARKGGTVTIERAEEDEA